MGELENYDTLISRDDCAHKTNCIENILKSIDDNNLCPKKTYSHQAKEYALILFAVSATIIGGLAVSTIFFLLSEEDWSVLRYTKQNPLLHSIYIIPYLWILALLALAWVAEQNIRRVKTIYRIESYKLLTGSIVISMMLGIVYYEIGIEDKVDSTLRNNFPVYGKVVHNSRDSWMQPESGFLSGSVQEIRNYQLIMSDQNGQTWEVRPISNEIWTVAKIIATGTEVKIMGATKNATSFEASVISAW